MKKELEEGVIVSVDEVSQGIEICPSSWIEIEDERAKLTHPHDHSLIFL